jgi:hypothetical protein
MEETRRKKTHPAVWAILAGSVGLVAFAVINAVVVNSDDEGDQRRAAESATQERCEAAVADRLRVPADASFQDVGAFDQGQGRYKVIGTVVGTRFTCVLSADGDDWQLVSVTTKP